MQVSGKWQEIADQKAENHESSIGSNTFSPFYFDVIILSCSVINRNSTVARRVLLPIGNFPNTYGSVIYRYGNFLPTLYRLVTGTVFTLTSREHSYSLHLANGGMERCSCWQRLPTSKVCHAQKDHVHLKLKS